MKSQIVLQFFFPLISVQLLYFIWHLNRSTVHLMTHFLKITVNELRNNINVYASRNMPWIEKVCAQFFEQLDVTSAVYIMEIVSGIQKFDEMAILLA